MGCAISNINNEEGVVRSLARKRFLKHAVAFEHALASAHVQYLDALRCSGVAFHQFGYQAAQQWFISPATSSNLLLGIGIVEDPPDALSSAVSSSIRSTPTSHHLHQSDHHQDATDHDSPSSFSLDSSFADRSFLSSLDTVGEAGRASLAGTRSPCKSFGLNYKNPRKEWSCNAPLAMPPSSASARAGSSWQNVFSEHSLSEDHEASDYRNSASEVEFKDGTHIPERIWDEDRTTSSAKAGSSRSDALDSEDNYKPGTPTSLKSEALDKGGSPGHAAAVVEASSQQIGSIQTMNNMKLDIIVSSEENDLLAVLIQLDELFLKAAESGEHVALMLDMKNANGRGAQDTYATKIDEVDVSQNGSTLSFWSCHLSRSIPSSLTLWIRDHKLTNVSVEQKAPISAHASTLDRIFAWEKKLSDEVKCAETVKVDLEKKCSLLQHQDLRGEDSATKNKTRASVQVLQAQFMVALQAVDIATKAVEELRDDELYLHLLELLGGLKIMWKKMLDIHITQHKIVQEIKLANYCSVPRKVPGSSHKKSTLQLAKALESWIQSFSWVLSTQRDYLQSLNGWLQTSLAQPESEMHNDSDFFDKESDVSTPISVMPIFHLCHNWRCALDKLPDKETLDSISKLADSVKHWIRLQSEEVKRRKRVEYLEAELKKKEQHFRALEERYFLFNPGSRDYSDANNSPRKASLCENRGRLNQFQIKVEQERTEMEKSVHATRATVLSSIQHLLPEVFDSMTLFASVAHHIYKDLSTPRVGNTLASPNR